MASPGSYIRSAARATFSAYRSVPVRWRLAGGSAALTFVILAAFAAGVGVVTTNELRGQFNDQVHSAADQLRDEIQPLTWGATGLGASCRKNVSLSDYVATEHAQIRIFDDSGTLWCTQDQVHIRGTKPPKERPSFTTPLREGIFQQLGYRIVVPRKIVTQPKGTGSVWLVYAVPLSDLDRTLGRVRLFLLLGVLGGTVLALLAGLATAQRAIRPIVELTGAAREIERTRDPSRHVPLPQAEDEVAELARTLEGMLQSLDEARNATESILERQREFVADASHELRTPLTSVLASLELLTEELDGEQAETAQGALRSARRMRRLVGDLLLLARADARRAAPYRLTELDEVVTEAAAELGTLDDDHELQVDAAPVVIAGARDDLHRMVLNLIENAVTHTPPGTHIRVSTATENGDAVLVVEDDGPGVPPELGTRVFERFIRGGRDGGRGSGLGLSIVHSVAESHGGSVVLETSVEGSGARFVVRLPAAGGSPPTDDQAPQTSTTTGSTIGRRRSRS
ncbi:MAG TPA: HAMP domain-containing sensor histidine kinase [Solirubrobacteraceae bacterium]|nr:HAMP domain-containing sensor histidine kinase [Solirubrobacteraceae bacterium]